MSFVNAHSSFKLRTPALLAGGAIVLSLSACGGSSQTLVNDATTVATPDVTPTSTTTTIGTPSINSTTRCGTASFDAEMLKAVNVARAVARTCGTTSMPAVPALSVDSRLTQAANGHSLDMAATNTMTHTGSNGSNMGQRITAAGYSWNWAAENVAGDYRSLSAVMTGWLDSAGHCANIMSANVTQMGASCQAATDGKYYWTQVFARSQ